jgi:hypothetical protein
MSKMLTRSILRIRETIAKCGRASAYFAPSLGKFATPGVFMDEAQLERLLKAAEADGLHVEKFVGGDGTRWAWITDQSQGPREAIPPWAETRGWPTPP